MAIDQCLSNDLNASIETHRNHTALWN